MAGAADLEINLILAFELDLAIVQAARKEHQAINTDQRVAIEPLIFRSVKLRGFRFGLCRHAISFSPKFAEIFSQAALYRIEGYADKITVD